FYVLHRNCSCANNCSLANCDTWAHKSICTNPRVGANHNRQTQQRKIRLGVIVCSRAKMRAMRDRDARPQRQAPKIINKDVLANRAFISRLKVPWKINGCRWIHMHGATDLCTETPEQKPSPTKERPRAKSEKRLHDIPKHPADHLAR